MDKRNCSSLTELIFLGITDNIENKMALFTMVLLVYLINLLANLGMITLIRMDLQLHTPMYFASATSPSVTSAFPQQLCSRCWWINLPRTSNLLQWLCSAVLCLLYLYWSWISSAGSDGLWPVQGHQQPLALCGQHVQWGVLPARGWGLPSGNGQCSDAHDISILHMFLWVKWDLPFLLWFTSTFPPFLLWYTGQWVGVIHYFYLHWTQYHFRSPCLLLLYYPFSLEDPLCWGEVQSFFHLHLPC